MIKCDGCVRNSAAPEKSSEICTSSSWPFESQLYCTPMQLCHFVGHCDTLRPDRWMNRQIVREALSLAHVIRVKQGGFGFPWMTFPHRKGQKPPEHGCTVTAEHINSSQSAVIAKMPGFLKRILCSLRAARFILAGAKSRTFFPPAA